MAFSNPTEVTVNNTADLVLTGRAPQGGPGSETPYKAVVYNNGATTCFLGGAGVTDADGLPLLAGASFTVEDIGTDDELYAVTSAGSTTLRVLEVV